MSTVTGVLIDVEGDIPFAAPTPVQAPVTPERTAADGTDLAKTFNVTISDETLKRYVDACEDVRTLSAEQVDWKLKGARNDLEHTRKLISHVKETLAKFQQTHAKQAAAVKELVEDDKWYFGKVIKGKKAHNEKVERQLEELHKAEEALHEQETQLATLGKNEAQQKTLVDELARKAILLQRAREYEAAVVAQCFTGFAGDAKENELERVVEQSKAKLAELSQYKVAYASAGKSLANAHQLVQQALQFYDQAYRLAGADVAQDFLRPMPFHNSPMGVMMDVRKRQVMEAAMQNMAGAAQMVLNAKSTLPSIPDVDIDRIQTLTDPRESFFVDLVFDNVLIDMKMRKQIDQDLEQCNWLAEQIKTSLEWVEQWQRGRIDRDLGAMQSQCTTQQSALDAYRRECMQKMIAAKHLEKVMI